MSSDLGELLLSVTAAGAESARDLDRLVQQLWARHGSAVFALALRLVKDRDHAADVCQQTFVNAIKGIPRLSSSRAENMAFEPWLLQIARNEVRRMKRRRSRVLSNADLGTHPDEAAPDHLEPDPAATDPAVALELREELEILRDCLKRLSARLQRVIDLVDIQELPRLDVLAMLDWTDGNLRQAIHVARARLRRCVEERRGDSMEVLP